jgi:hypothetical protein
LMGHEPLAGALGEQRQSAKTASGAARLFPRPPEACTGGEVVPTVGREHLPRHLSLVVLQGRVELVRPLAPTAVDDQHHLCAGGAAGRHHVMEIVAQLLGSPGGHDCREDFGGTLLDGANHAEPHAAGEPAPGAIRGPRLAVACLCPFDVAGAERTSGPPRALGAAPPSPAGQGTAPAPGLLLIAHDDLPLTRPGLQSGKCERGRGPVSRMGSAPASGSAGAERGFFHAHRPLARPSWTPVWWANTVAHARQLHCEAREPGASGA